MTENGLDPVKQFADQREANAGHRRGAAIGTGAGPLHLFEQQACEM